MTSNKLGDKTDERYVRLHAIHTRLRETREVARVAASAPLVRPMGFEPNEDRA